MRLIEPSSRQRIAERQPYQKSQPENAGGSHKLHPVRRLDQVHTEQDHERTQEIFSDMPAKALDSFIVRPIPPFRLDLTAWALRRRPRNVIDRWDGSTYRRVISVGGEPVEVAVRQSGSSADPRLIVNTTPLLTKAADRRQIRISLDRLLGPRVDLAGWYRLAARDERLARVAERFRGVKPPRFPTLFEALVNAFACQQLSLEVGLELLNRLAARRGARVHTGDVDRYAFPDPAGLAAARPSQLRVLGFSGQKVRAIQDLSRAIARGHLDIEELRSASDEARLRERLLELRGVGRWTLEYVLLRGFGRLDVIPGDDVGAQNKLAAWLGRRRPLDYAGVHQLAERYRPYAGVVYFHLLLDDLEQRGVL
jgi:DNA-3-methyladenine glycosylase II